MHNLFTTLYILSVLASAFTAPLESRNNRCTPRFGNKTVSIINDLFEWGFPSSALPSWGDTMVLKVSTPDRPEFRITSIDANAFKIECVQATTSPPLVLTALGGDSALSLIPSRSPLLDIQKFIIQCGSCPDSTGSGCTISSVASPSLCVRQSGSIYSVPLLTPCLDDFGQLWVIG